MINKTSVLYIILMALLSSCGQHDRYVLIQGYAQGGTYSVKYNTLGKDGRIRLSPEEVRSAVDSILESIDNTLSGYNKGSLLSRLNSGDTIEFTPGGMLDEIYGMAASFYEETDGALDAVRHLGIRIHHRLDAISGQGQGNRSQLRNGEVEERHETGSPERAR